MYHHVAYSADNGHSVIMCPIKDAPPEIPFTIPDGRYLQSILRVTDPQPLGKGSTGRIYKAVLLDERTTPCVVKLHKDLLDNNRYMRIQFASNEEGGELILRNPSINHTNNAVFKAVVEEFKQEIDFSIRLTLGPKVFRLDITKPSTQPVAMGLWVEAQAEMKAQSQKPGYKYIHHIREFDLYTIPCIVSKQCDGDLLHLKVRNATKDYLFNLWMLLLSHVLMGLRFMHNEHVAHNDIKPANIFYAETHTHRNTCPFQALVADFGMSTQADAPMYVDFGTEAYACPEILPAFRARKVTTTSNHLSKASTRKQDDNDSDEETKQRELVPHTVPKHNDAYAFAKMGLVFWERLNQPDATEHDLLVAVNAQLRQEDPPKNSEAGLYGTLIQICRAPNGADRYALFQALQQ